jgi:acetylornithine deacetylase/succinyl-diaminopimelate desuccinylase-like protein
VNARANGGAAVKFVLEFEPCNAPALLTTPDSFTKLVADAIEKKTGRRPTLSTSGGTSDIAALTEIYAAILEDYFHCTATPLIRADAFLEEKLLQQGDHH